MHPDHPHEELPLHDKALFGLLLSFLVLIILMAPSTGAPAEASSAPTFSVSQTTVAYGTNVTVYWNGGSAAPSGCIVYVTNNNVNGYAPWGVTPTGANIIGIYSDTTLSAVCLGPGGEYVYPSPSTITVRLAVEPKLSLSPSHVASGGSTQVIWDGGTAASNCGVLYSDSRGANQVFRYGLFGNAAFSPVSTTTFTMTCTNKIDGAYLGTRPSAQVTVDPLSIGSCPSGHTFHNSQCYATVQSCSISNGTGAQTFSGGTYGACAATSCNSGYTLASGTCVSNAPVEPRACNVGDGSGTQTWNGSSWGGCVVHHCTAGYTLYNNTCYPSYAPRMTVSSSKVTSGDSVMVTWDGGIYAGNCGVYGYNASGATIFARSALSGAETVLITGNTRFDMTCINKIDGAYLQPRPSISVSLDTGSSTQTLTRQLANLNYARAQKWAATSGIWEVVWEGNGNIPGAATGPLAWSLPFDDDWNEPRVAAESFAFDTPSSGFLTIDRTREPDRRKGGLIGRHDEYLSVDTGLTFEFRARMLPGSADHGVTFIYTTGGRGYGKGELDPTFEFDFSAGKITAGGYGEERVNPNPVTAALTTTEFHTYRFVQQPGSRSFKLYVDNNTTPLLEAVGNFHKPSFYDDQDTAYFLLGAEGGGADGSAAGAMVIDYVRYRRGAFPPGASFTAPLPRLLPPLPPNVSASTTWTTVFDGTKLPQELGYTRSPSSWSLQGDGTLKLDTRTNLSAFEIADPMPGVTDIKGPYTVEFRAKVLPGNTDRGFSVAVVNGKTSLSLVLSPSKIETAMGLKPASYQAHTMDTTDGFHTYRLVHPARSQYGYVYVDDNPVPVIVDAHGSADTWRDHILLEMGTLPMVDRQNIAGANSLRSHVLIDYVRVSPTAYAPAP